MNWSEYKIFEKGDEVTGVIRKVEKGKVLDFVDEEYIRDFGDGNKECIRVEIECSNGVKIHKLFTLPENKIISKKSNLYMFKEKYGKLPEVDMVVNCIYTGQYFTLDL